MRIDLTCPVELWQCSLPSQDEPECTFVMNNLSDKVVISVQVALVCHDKEDKLLFRQMERVQGLMAGPGERFSIVLLPTHWQDVAGMELAIEKVWFDDATIWRKGTAPLTEYTSNQLRASRQLDQLRFVAGKDAVGYPQEQEHVWLCVCGRANDKKSGRCCRCGRRAETVFASFQQANVEQLVAVHEQKLKDIATRAREETSKLEEERAKANTEKRKKAVMRRRLCVLAAVLVLGGSGFLLWGLPALRFAQADALLTQGHIQEARAAFAALGDSPAIQEKLIRCDYLDAREWMQAGDLSGLQTAADAFAALGDYEDSHSLWQQSNYQIGEKELAAGAFESAAEAFQRLGEYRDSAEKLQETTYQQAEHLLQSEGFVAAQVLFQGLGEYKDAKDRVKAAEYAMGQKAEADNELETAIAHYGSLPGYEDADQRLQQACYALAEQKQREGAFEEAGKLYVRAGDYQDAQLRANNSLYLLAQENMRAGDYGKAAELYAQIVPYLDSESQSWECVYLQAEAALAAGQVEEANRLFTSIPQHRDALERAKECQYRLAQDNLQKGDATAAEPVLESLGDYKDSQKLLSQSRYGRAEESMGQGNYAAAAAIYEALDGYNDSAAKARQCHYQAANNAMLDKEYATAIEGFTAAGKYEDAPQRLAEATYVLAMQHKEKGEPDKAMEVLSGLPGDEKAQQEMAGLVFAKAKEKQKAGDLEGASELFLSLGQYEGAREEYLACQYDLAARLKNEGKMGEAGTRFLSLGDFRDAAEQGQACYQSAYGVVADPAREAFDKGDYAKAVEALEGFAMTGLPKEYDDLPELYNAACYAYAEQLYGQDKPYEALPYYLRILSYKDVLDKKLERRAYLVLGTWTSATGVLAEFRGDGTCNLMGTELFFRVDSYDLLTGKAAEELTPTHRLTTVTQAGMTLRGVADGSNTTYKFTRVSDGRFEPVKRPAPETGPLHEMLVQEDEEIDPAL